MSASEMPAFKSAVTRIHKPGVLPIARSEWTKLRSVRSTYWTLIATVVIMIGLGALFSLGATNHGSDNGDTVNAPGIGLYTLYFAQLAIGVLGVMVITAEYSSGMIRTTFTAVPQRAVVVVVKAVVFAIVAFVVALVTAFVTFFVSQAVLNTATPPLGVTITSPAALRIVIGAAVYLTGCAVLGLALGVMLRSTAGAITVFTVLMFVAPILANFIPESWHRDAISRYLPSNAGLQVLEPTTNSPDLRPLVGLSVLIVWALVALLISLVLVSRRDV